MIDMTSQILARNRQVRDNVWDEGIFLYLLTLEQRRSKRSYHPFVLALLNAIKENDSGPSILQFAMPAITASIRETDLVGWIENPRVLGIIFTQVGPVPREPSQMIAPARLEKALQEKLGHDLANTIAISLHIFPEDFGDQEPCGSPGDRFVLSATSISQ